MKTATKLTSLILALFLLASCGGGGGGGPTAAPPATDPPDNSNKVAVTGSVYDGPVVGASVRVTDFFGNLLATATTTSVGNFSCTVDVPDGTLVLVSVQGGTDLGEDGILGGPVPDEPNTVVLKRTARVSGGALTDLWVTPVSTVSATLVEKGMDEQEAVNLVLTSFSLPSDALEVPPQENLAVFVANRIVRDLSTVSAKVDEVTQDSGYENIAVALSDASTVLVDPALGCVKEAFEQVISQAVVTASPDQTQLLSTVVVSVAELATGTSLESLGTEAEQKRLALVEYMGDMLVTDIVTDGIENGEALDGQLTNVTEVLSVENAEVLDSVELDSTYDLERVAESVTNGFVPASIYGVINVSNGSVGGVLIKTQEGDGSTFTSADGSFSLNNLLAGDNVLIIQAPGGDYKEVQLLQIAEGENRNLGAISLTNGVPLPGSGGGGGGTTEYPPPEYTQTASMTGTVRLSGFLARSANRNVALTTDQTTGLWLTPPNPELLPGEPVAPGGEIPPPPTGATKVPVSPEGDFSVAGLPSGTGYSLTYISTTGETGQMKVSLAPGEIENIVIEEGFNGGAVDLSVESASNGMKLGAARVLLLETNLETVSDSGTGQAGFTSVPPGDYTLRVTLDGYAPHQERITVEPGTATQLDAVRLDHMKGSLTGYARGLGLEDHSNLLVYAKAPSGVTHTALTDANGRYRIDNIPVGQGYSVLAYAHDFNMGKADNVEVLLGAVSTAPDIELHPSGTETGALTGFARFEGVEQFGHAGILVSVEGTDSEAVTSRDGSWILNNLSPGVYVVNFTDSNHVTVTKTAVEVVAGSSTLTDTVTLSPRSGGLVGLVVDDSGAPVANALVSASGSGNTQTAVTDLEGAYSFPALTLGVNNLTASKEGYVAAAGGAHIAEGQTADVSAQPLILTRLALRGVAELSGGADHSGITVSVTGLEVTPAVTNAAGEFTLYGVGPGSYQLQFSKSGYLTKLVPVAAINYGDNEISYTVTLERATGMLEGVALLMSRTDNSGITVSVEGTPYTTVTGARGYWSMQLPTMSYAQAVSYTHPDFQTEVDEGGFQVETAATTTLASRTLASLKGSLTGLVRDDAGAPGEGAIVSVTTPDETITAAAGADGSFTLTGIPVGNHRVSATKEGHGTGYADVTIQSGTTADIKSAPITLERLLVTGAVSLGSGAASHAGVTVTALGTDLTPAVTDEAGNFVLYGVASGSYELQFTKSGYLTRMVSLAVVGDGGYAIPYVIGLEAAFGTLDGIVTLTGRNNYGGVTVGLEGTGYSAETNVMGQWSMALPEGAYPNAVTFNHADFQAERLEGGFTITAGDTTTLGSVAMASRTGVATGVVFDDTGAPLAGAAVTVATAENTVTDITDSLGAYRLAGIPAGARTLTATKEGHDSASQEVTVVADGEVAAAAMTLARLKLSGVAELVGKADHSGITVSVVGVEVTPAVTNSAGEFVLFGVGPGSYHLQFSAAGYVNKVVAVAVAYQGDYPMPYTVLLDPSVGTVEGLVLLSGRMNHSGAAVSVEGTPYTASTNALGYWSMTLPVGTYSNRILFSHSDFVGGELTGGFEIFAGALTTLEQVSLASRTGSVTGVVKDENGVPLGGALVSVTTYESTMTDVADPQGVFTLAGLPVGSYVVEASLSGYRAASVEVSIAADDLLDLSSDPIVLNRLIVSGHVELEGATDHSGVAVSLLGGSATAVTDSGGLFRLFGVGEGNYMLQLAREGYTTVTLPITVAGADNYEIPYLIGMYRSMGMLKGYVQLSERSDHSGVAVTVDSTTYTTVSDSYGIWSMALPVGVYANDLQLTHADYVSQTIQGGFEITLGDTTELPDTTVLALRTGSIEGLVRDELGNGVNGATVTVNALAGSGAAATYSRDNGDGTFTDGYFLLTDIPAGTHQLTASLAGYAAGYATDAQVAANSRTDLTGTPVIVDRMALTGAVKLEDVATANAGHNGVTASLSGLVNDTATSAGDGSFVFTGVAPGNYTLQFTNEGYVTETMALAIAGHQGFDLTSAIVLERNEGSLGGVVTLANKTDHSGVTVSVENTEFSAQTNSLGQWSMVLPGGAYTAAVTFSHPDFIDEAYSDGFTITPGGAASLEQVSLTPDTGTVSGLVTDDAGSPLNGATLTVLTPEGDVTGASYQRDNGDGTFTDGYFEITNVPTGSHQLVASLAGYASDQVSGVRITAGELHALGAPLTLNRMLLTGTVRRADVESPSAGHDNISVNLSGSGTGSAVTLEGGGFQIESVAPGTYELQLSAENYLTKNIQLTVVGFEGYALTQPIELEPNLGVLNGRVLLANRSEHGSVSVSVEGTNYQATTDSMGLWRINLPEGAYTAKVLYSHPDFVDDNYADGFDIVSGQTTTLPELSMQPDKGSIRGTVTDGDENAVSGATAYVVTPEGNVSSPPTDADGVFTISNVPVGTHTVIVSLAGWGTGSLPGIAVSAGSETDATATPIILDRMVMAGRVLLQGETDNSGVLINIGNSSLPAYTTDQSTGDFSIAGVGEGTYQVQFSKEGFVTETVPVTVLGEEGYAFPYAIVLERDMGEMAGRVLLEGRADHSGVQVVIEDDSGNTFSDTTDALGMWTKPLLAGQYLSVTFNQAGFTEQIVNNGGQGWSVFKGERVSVDTVNLTSNRGKISGVVVDEADPANALGGAAVTATDGSTDYATVTATDGSFTLSGLLPGTYQVNVSLAGHGPGQAADVVVVSNQTTQAGDIVLDRMILSGTVDLADSDDDSGVNVTLLGTNKSATTDAAGAFSIPGVGPGDYWIQYFHGDYVTKTAPLTVVGQSGHAIPQAEVMELNLGILSGRAYLSGRSEHSGITVTVGSYGSVTTDSLGRWSMALEDQSYADMTVSYSYADFTVSPQQVSFTIIPGTVTELLPHVELTLQTATVKVMVENDLATPITSAQVTVTGPEGTYLGVYSASDSAYMVNGIPPGGPYVLSASYNSYSEFSEEIGTLSAQETWERLNNIVLDRRIVKGRLYFEDIDPAVSSHSGITVSIIGDPTVAPATTDGDGFFELQGVGQGSYLVQATYDGYEPLSIPILVPGETGLDISVSEYSPLIKYKGIIEGIAQLSGRSDHSGIRVELSGMDWTTTDSGGRWSLTVPVGQYSVGLAYSKDQFGTYTDNSLLTVAAGAVNRLPLVTLSQTGVNVKGGVRLEGDPATIDYTLVKIQVKDSAGNEVVPAVFADALGFFTVPDVPLGEYDVVVSCTAEYPEIVTQVTLNGGSLDYTMGWVELRKRYLRVDYWNNQSDSGPITVYDGNAVDITFCDSRATGYQIFIEEEGVETQVFPGSGWEWIFYDSNQPWNKEVSVYIPIYYSDQFPKLRVKLIDANNMDLPPLERDLIVESGLAAYTTFEAYFPDQFGSPTYEGTRGKRLHFKYDAGGYRGAVVTVDTPIPSISSPQAPYLLRDDGENGDAVADDGIYELDVIVDTSTDSVVNWIEGTVITHDGWEWPLLCNNGLTITTAPSIENVYSYLSNGNLYVEFESNKLSAQADLALTADFMSWEYAIFSAVHYDYDEGITYFRASIPYNFQPEDEVFYSITVYDPYSPNYAAREEVFMVSANQVAPPPVLAAEAGNDEVGLAWINPSADTAVGFNIYRDDVYLDFVGWDEYMPELPGQPPGPYYIDKSVTGGSTYTYKVTALDLAGRESAPTESVTVTVKSGVASENLENVTGLKVLVPSINYMVASDVITVEESGLLVMLPGSNLQIDQAYMLDVKGTVYSYGGRVWGGSSYDPFGGRIRFLEDANAPGRTSLFIDSTLDKVSVYANNAAAPGTEQFPANVRFDGGFVMVAPSDPDYQGNFWHPFMVEELDGTTLEVLYAWQLYTDPYQPMPYSIRLGRVIDGNVINSPLSGFWYAPVKIMDYAINTNFTDLDLNLEDARVLGAAIDYSEVFVGNARVRDTAFTRSKLDAEYMNTDVQRCSITGGSYFIQEVGGDISKNWWGTTDVQNIAQLAKPQQWATLFPIAGSDQIMTADFDGDGLIDIYDGDADDDGYCDIQEQKNSAWDTGPFYDPLNPASHPGLGGHAYDCDGDGTPDEIDNDDDADSVSDVREAALGMNPLSKDTDGDGVEDRKEELLDDDDPVNHMATDPTRFPLMGMRQNLVITPANTDSNGRGHIAGNLLCYNCEFQAGYKADRTYYYGEDTTLVSSTINGTKSNPVEILRASYSMPILRLQAGTVVTGATFSVDSVEIDAGSRVEGSDLEYFYTFNNQGFMKDSAILTRFGYSFYNLGVLDHVYMWNDGTNSGNGSPSWGYSTMTDSKVDAFGSDMANYGSMYNTVVWGGLVPKKGSVVSNSMVQLKPDINAHDPALATIEDSDVDLLDVIMEPITYDNCYMTINGAIAEYNGSGSYSETTGAFTPFYFPDPTTGPYGALEMSTISSPHFPQGDYLLWTPSGVGAQWDPSVPDLLIPSLGR